MVLPDRLRRLFKEGARGLGLGGPRVIAPSHHPIRPEQIQPAIREIITVLERRGYTAWIVGGAVRDLVLRRTPKDYDIATDARPEEVKRCFGNARIIGRRFRLVHLELPGMTVEVATFRGKPRAREGGMIHRDNTWGTPREDAFRRDFTVNALAFDVARFAILDYVGGMADLETRTIRTIAPPQVSFREDPVRMLRAVRFSTRLGFAIAPEVAAEISALAPVLRLTKRHRLAEETRRFLTSGQAGEIFAALAKFGLLAPMLGLEQFPRLFGEALPRQLPARLGPYLRALDQWVAAGREPVPPAVALLGLVVALAREEVQGVLAGGPAYRRANPSGAGRTWGALPRLLGDWGLLKGQVEPAITILAALGMVAHAEPTRAGKPRRPPLGARAAWALVVLLQETLGWEEGLAARGLAAMPGLPELPIPDHPSPPLRARRRPLGRQRGGSPPGQGQPPRRPGEAAPNPNARRRPRRRGRGPRPPTPE